MIKSSFLFVFVFASTLVSVAEERKPPTTLTATVEDVFTQKLLDGNVLTKTVKGVFYRDSEGRTRIEREQLVMIKDPRTQTNVVIDMGTKLAKRYVASAPNKDYFPQPPMRSGNGRPAPRDLGKRVIAGVTTIGTEFSAVVPPGAIGNLGPLKQTTEVWYSEDYALPVMTISSDPLRGVHIQRYSNIVDGAHVDSALFNIPADVRVEEIKPVPSLGSQIFRQPKP